MEQALHRALKLHYGYEAFRPQQLEALSSTLEGKDVLLILPTGGGKSITFQLAPLYRDQISIVITPLLALGKDQVARCLDLGIEAALWSSETPEERKKAIARELLADYEDTTLRLLYTTPESLCREELRDLLLQAHAAGKLCSLAVDEAHCCSEWGHDFRPAYLNISEVRQLFPRLPVIAVTATATADVRRSIIELLALKSPVQLLGSFNRPNIGYEVRLKELIGNGSQAAVFQDLLAFVKEREGQCGIIYVRLRKTCDWLASELQNAEVDAAAYHAGKDAQQRSRVQSSWSEGAQDVVVATIAFGMGIDKADVRWVVHWDPPARLYQESGRAGRDGAPSEHLLYASNEELKEARKMEKAARKGSTAAVAGYIQEARCRRRSLLSYFGEQRGPCSAEGGNSPCDFCTNPQAVRAQLSKLRRKLEAAAEAGAAAGAAAGQGRPDADPYDRCDAGSGGEEGGRRAGGSASKGDSRDDDDEEENAAQKKQVPDFWQTARHRESSLWPAGTGARLPVLGMPRVRPHLPLKRTLAASAEAPDGASAGPAAAAVASEGQEPSSAEAGAPSEGAVASTAEPQAGAAQPAALGAGLKRPPLRPLIPNRFKRPAAGAGAAFKPPGPCIPAAQQNTHHHQQQQQSEQQAGDKSPVVAGAGAAGAASKQAAGADDDGAVSHPGGPTPEQGTSAEGQPIPAPRLVSGLRRGGFKPPLLVRPPAK